MEPNDYWKHVRESALYVLGGVIVMAVVAFLLMLIFRPTPPENKDALMMALGALLAAFGSVVGYFFGSSKGSADKTDAINSALKSEPPKTDTKTP